MRVIVGYGCPKHGYSQGDHCPKCAEDKPKNTLNINTEEWVEGWYEHIGPEPIYIESKKQLFEECEKHGNMPRAFLKPKSQGKGYEIRRHN